MTDFDNETEKNFKLCCKKAATTAVNLYEKGYQDAMQGRFEAQHMDYHLGHVYWQGYVMGRLSKKEREYEDPYTDN